MKKGADPRLRHERRVEFLGEQDGEAEGRLKAALVGSLRSFPKAMRAYLAQVGFSPRSQPGVALCVCPASAESRDIVDEIQRTFADLFAEGADLDILFPSQEEENDLRRVCQPFFERRARRR